MNNKAALILALLALVVVLAVAVTQLSTGGAPASLPPESVALDAEERLPLDGPKGPVALGDFRGKLVLLYFGYTYCPDICPTTLATWAQALAQLKPAELARVQPIFISVDPERDTAERLGPYALFFHPALLGVTGTPETLRAVARRHGAIYARQNSPSIGYVIDHTASTFVIDAQGRPAEKLRYGARTDEVLAAIRRHLPK